MKKDPFPVLAIAISLAAIPSLGFAKTVRECDAEWTANKPAIQAAGETKKAFVTRCRVDTAATTAPLSKSATPAPSAPPTTEPQPQPVPERGRSAKATPTTAPAKANQFTTEAEAKGHCPGERVVWANTHSSIYHYAGTRNYGTTKSGAYMCERDTAAAGIRAAKNENPSQ